MGSLDVTLTKEEIAAIDNITQTIKAVGLRYVWLSAFTCWWPTYFELSSYGKNAGTAFE